MFDSELLFVPEVMKMTIEILEIRNQFEYPNLVQKTKFLRKHEHLCQKPLVVKVSNNKCRSHVIFLSIEYKN